MPLGNSSLDTFRHNLRNPSSTYIHRLSQDVLALIFTDVLDITHHDFWTNPSLSSHTTVVLSHVCTTWRHVALSNHGLWKRILRVQTWDLDCVEAYLERSHPCPVDIELIAIKHKRSIYPEARVPVEDICTNALELGRVLKKHSIRFRSLCVRVHHRYESLTWDLLRGVQEGSSPLFPSLQKLELEVMFSVGHFPGPTLLGSKLWNQDAPVLSALKLGVITPRGPVVTSANTHLTSLCLDARCMPFEGFRSTLSNCTALETLVLDQGFYDYSRADLTKPSLVHPSLRSFTLLHSRIHSNFLLSFSFPRLQHLGIVPYRLNFNHHSRESDHGFQRQDTLRELALALDCDRKWYHDNLRIALESEVFRIATLSPAVEIVTILGELRWAVVNVLMREDLKSVWPKLHTLVVKSPLRRETLVKLARTRENAGYPLRRVYMAEIQSSIKDVQLSQDCGLQLIERDLWDEFERTALYYPLHNSAWSERSVQEWDGMEDFAGVSFDGTEL